MCSTTKIKSSQQLLGPTKMDIKSMLPSSKGVDCDGNCCGSSYAPTEMHRALRNIVPKYDPSLGSNGVQIESKSTAAADKIALRMPGMDEQSLEPLQCANLGAHIQLL